MAWFTVHSLFLLSLLILGADAFQQPHGDAHAGVHVKRRLLSSRDQLVKVDGIHSWRAPIEGQQRGPCPGLNALANHGYISHDGIVTLAEVIPAANAVFGMGLDVAGLLSTLSVVFGGAPVSLFPRFSIGGESKAVSLLLNGLLGVAGLPQGLNMTHNIVEGDASPTRNDLYETGDAWSLDLDKFRDMLQAVPDGRPVEQAVLDMGDFAAKRFHQSVATNPHFYYGPVSGLVARNAAFLFVARFFSNYSSENPSGQLNHAALKSFYGVTGDDADMVYTYGHERIPEDFYRIPKDYTLLDMNANIVAMAARHPVLANIGGNTGNVDSFTPIDIENLSGGVFGATTLLESNNLICFALQTVKMVAPSFTNNLFATLAKPLNLILDALNVPLLSLECPSMEAIQGGGKDVIEQLGQYDLPGLDQGLL